MAAMQFFLRRMILAIAVCIILLGILLGTIGNLSHRSYFASLLIAVLTVGLIFWVQKKKQNLPFFFEQQSPARVCALLSLFCLILNGIWVLVFHPVQAPDYQTFFQAASDLANGGALSGKDYIAMFPHILGYASFLSVCFRLFSVDLLTAALVNVVLTTVSGIILYLLSLKFSGRKAAFFVFLFWTLCPSKLLYNTMSLSEPFYTCLILLFFLLVSEIIDNRKEEKIGKDVSAGLLSGLVLGLVNAARPIGIIPMIAFFLWLFFLADWKRVLSRKKTVLIFSCLLLTAYFATCKIWNCYAADKLGQEPPTVPGYSIYVGFNPETQGSYADEDMELLQRRYFGEYDRNAEATQQSMLESAKIRIDQNRKSIPSLMIHKLGTLLGHDEGGAFYSKESLSDRGYSLCCLISNVWYYLVCILAVSGCIATWRIPRDDSFMIIPLCLIGIVLAQLVVEVAARYHYCLIPMLLLLASPALKKGHPPA